MREATEAAQGKMLEMVRSSERDLERQWPRVTQDLLQAMMKWSGPCRWSAQPTKSSGNSLPWCRMNCARHWQ